MRAVSCLLLLQMIVAAAVADDSIRVVTYNIRYANPGDGPDFWPHRAQAVAATIAAHDIAGLQEVTYRQLNDLRGELPQFESYSVGRNDGKHGGEHCTIFYRRDRFEAIDQGTFWLSETPEQIGSKSWDAAITRICSWTVLRDKQTGQKLFFANTHFDHRGQLARAESGKLIRRMIRDRSESLPVILLGDFNCLPDSQPYQNLIGGDGKRLVDARTASNSAPAGPNSTWCGFREIVPGRIIDHVFIAGPITVKSMEVLNPKTKAGRFASDHLPVQLVATMP